MDLFSEATDHAQKGELEEAIECYSRVIERDPAFPRLYRYRGTAHAQAGHDKEALADFDEALRRKPEAEVYALRTIHAKTGRYSEAIADFTESPRPISAERPRQAAAVIGGSLKVCGLSGPPKPSNRV